MHAVLTHGCMFTSYLGPPRYLIPRAVSVVTDTVQHTNIKPIICVRNAVVPWLHTCKTKRFILFCK